MTNAVEIVPQDRLEDVANFLGDIYAAAFAPPPYSEPPESAARFVQHLRRHSTYAGFRLVVVREAEGLVGFAYGYESSGGQWWHDLVSAALDADERARWLGDAFEVVDLAVLPRAQGLGLGRRLHDTLLRGLVHRTAVLSTRKAETVALRLYRRSGWQTILDDFRFPGSEAVWLILGKPLQAPGEGPLP